VTGPTSQKQLGEFRRIYRSTLRPSRPGWRARAGRIKRRITWPVVMLRLAVDVLRRCGGPVADEVGIARWRQFLAMCWIGLRYRYPPEVYYRYRLFLPERARDARAYLHWDEHNRVLDRLVRQNYPIEGEQLDDKRSFIAWCREHDLPMVGTVANFDSGRCDVEAGALPDVDLFSKPAGGRGGDEGRAWVRTASGRYDGGGGTTLTREELIRHLEQASEHQPYLLQRRIEPADELRAMTPGGLPTVRIVTGRPPGGPPELLAASFGIPTGQHPVDNYHAGGICAKIDRVTGRLGPGVTVRPEDCLTEHRTHPDTGEAIAGVVVPEWPAMAELALRAHAAADSVAFIGWDIVPTPSGPVLLEANVRWDAAMPQAPEGDPLGHGPYLPWLLAHFEAEPHEQ
jgi:hypothetical protein